MRGYIMTFSNILFNKIENGLIFTSDYRTFVKNNTISFSNAGIAVVYDLMAQVKPA